MIDESRNKFGWVRLGNGKRLIECIQKVSYEIGPMQYTDESVDSKEKKRKNHKKKGQNKGGTKRKNCDIF